MPSTKQTAELAAEPRPWQRMPFERAKRTMEFDGQEVGRVFAAARSGSSSCRSCIADVVGHAFGVALRRAFPGQLFKPFLRGQPVVRPSVG